MDFKYSKILSVIMISFCFWTVNAQFDEPKSFAEMVAAVESLAESCEVRPTREHIKAVLLSKKEVSRETKCFRRCLMELLDLHEPESTRMKEETAMEVAGMVYPERKEEVLIIIQACNERNKRYEDRCDAAHEHFVCLHEELLANGFEIPHHREWMEEERAV